MYKNKGERAKEQVCREALQQRGVTKVADADRPGYKGVGFTRSGEKER